MTGISLNIVNEPRRQREELSGLGVSEKAIGLTDKLSRLDRSNVIEAIKKGEIGTGIDEIRKKVAAIEAKGKEK